ncbi:ATP-binding protein [Salinisphaera sp. P385]|uniref:ATP-binding protein n=1 Tax=Spectribacter acetivorans TaxID=3075603 RepID=A0ABU3BBQ9_9GAMM|nr:ATP-binding protein [Salinisphaera sp. P385]MDT0619445.1 ATP-binding protein [Salinisphaera sp. P385]
MDEQLIQRLHGLMDRGEALLDRFERRADGAAMVDWQAPAFRWSRHDRLQPISRVNNLPLSDLHGIAAQKDSLVANTRQFLNGKPANNALLWGARGTGKSSLIRALLHEFADRGLRLVQVDARDLVDLPDIAPLLSDRPERFIIFCDDLSFGDDDPGYKALKSMLDGSLLAPPDNLLIYATSNRRHLLPEYLDENRQACNVDGEIHHGDAVEEKLSLSERFGLWLSFYPFDQDAYLAIVRSHLDRLGQAVDGDASFRRAALQWALARGVRSGRAARQFALHWLGQQPDEPA